jgi:protein-disulfide isomerase
MDDYFDSVRAQLRAACEAQAHGRSRSPLRWARFRPAHVMLAASALVAVAVFVVALGGLSARRPTSAPGDTAPVPLVSVKRVVALLEGVPQSGTLLGDRRAPVTVTVFGAVPCSACRDALLSAAFRRLVTQDVRSGAVRLAYRSVCTAPCATQRKTRFDSGQAAAYAAGRQDRFWDYLLLSASFSGRQPIGDLRALAAAVGLNVGRWQQDRHGPAVAGQLRTDASVVSADQVKAIPELIVAGPNAQVSLRGAVSYRQLEHAVAQARTVPGSPLNAIVKDCEVHGRLTQRYTRPQLRRALAVMPVAVKQYTNCVSVINHALHTAR